VVCNNYTPVPLQANVSREVALFAHTNTLSPLSMISHQAHNTTPWRGCLAPSFETSADPQNLWSTGDGGRDQRWKPKYPKLPFSVFHPAAVPERLPPSLSIKERHFILQRLEPFSLDLVEAMKCQIDFARKITGMYPYPVPEEVLLDSQCRYAKFMNLVHLNTTSCRVQSLDIDLFWYTH
jgi:hypothetical protein